MKKSMLPVMLLLVAVAAFAPPPASCRAAEPNRLNFQKDESYDIYYDLEDTAFLVISFKSDWLYPPYQSQELVRQLKRRHVDATYCDLPSTYGHDAFLVDMEEQMNLVRYFLDRVYNNGKTLKSRAV